MEFCCKMRAMPSSSLLAAVDLGSNSFRLVIGRIETTPVGDQIRPVDQIKETVRLAAGLGSGNTLSAAAQDRAVDALRRFGERLRTFPPERVRAVATNTFRVATDARAFLEQAQQALGFDIEVIAGREEARLIYLGAAHTLPADGQRRLVVDIGGGSTECIVGTDYTAEELESVPLGCVGLSQRFFHGGVVDRSSFDAARWACRDLLAPLAQRYRATGWRRAIGTSGTAKALWQIAQTDLGEPRLDRTVLATLEAQLLKAGHPDRMRLTALKPDRRPVLPGGLAMMSAAFEEFGIESMDYCDGALREGVLYDLLGRSTGADMREVTVAQMIRRHGLDERHGLAVAELATLLYRDNARGPSDEVGRTARLVGWAAQLREIGLSIGHADFHKHGAYILANCDMPGFSIDEQARLAALVLGQTGGLTKMRSRLDDPDGWLRVLCLRLAVILHRRRDGVLPPSVRLRIKSTGARLELPADWTRAHPLTDQTLRQESAEWSKAGAWPLLYQPV
jgi:exopolyphosphatase/guanosine-5'-triphosphate,3'-diphosphate pyrophosphatase